MAMTKADIKSSMVLDAIEIWEKIGRKVKVTTIAWIKAHIGHEGNELADQEAKKGTEQSNTIIATPLPRKDIKKINKRPN